MEQPKIIIENGIEYISQPIHFTPAITDKYYVGDHFASVNFEKELKMDSVFQQTDGFDKRIARAGMDGFMADLVEELTELFDKKCKYDGYAFGYGDATNDPEINFYWLIEKNNYVTAIKKLRIWELENNFGEMRYEIKNINDATT